jgi:RNA polymerase II subunit A small phosphatase-like protein
MTKFLKSMAKQGNVTLFTAGVKTYADAILEHIDPDKTISKRFYRENCKIDAKGHPVKDMALVTKNMSRLVIIDDSEVTFQLYKKNTIKIEQWSRQMKNDCELLKVEELIA